MDLCAFSLFWIYRNAYLTEFFLDIFLQLLKPDGVRFSGLNLNLLNIFRLHIFGGRDFSFSGTLAIWKTFWEPGPIWIDFLSRNFSMDHMPDVLYRRSPTLKHRMPMQQKTTAAPDMSRLCKAPFSDPAFRTTLTRIAAETKKPIIGHAWEGVLAKACQTHDPSKRVIWDPRSNRSGVDVTYDDVGYSCKTTRFKTASRIVVTPSYRLNRCPTDADAILEIDRPHRHNFEFYAILARHEMEEKEAPGVYEVHAPPAELTLARRFDWDMQNGRLITDWRDGVRLEIVSQKRNNGNKRPQRRLVVTWILGEPVMAF